MKNFNKQTFIISTVLIGLLLIPSFLAEWANDEGTLGINIILLTLSKLFYVIRFPTHTLFWKLFSSNAGFYMIGLILNCLFYGLLIERTIPLFNFKKAKG